MVSGLVGLEPSLSLGLLAASWVTLMGSQTVSP